jgi:hypothetical protein
MDTRRNCDHIANKHIRKFTYNGKKKFARHLASIIIFKTVWPTEEVTEQDLDVSFFVWISVLYTYSPLNIHRLTPGKHVESQVCLHVKVSSLMFSDFNQNWFMPTKIRKTHQFLIHGHKLGGSQVTWGQTYRQTDMDKLKDLFMQHFVDNTQKISVIYITNIYEFLQPSNDFTIFTYVLT